MTTRPEMFILIEEHHRTFNDRLVKGLTGSSGGRANAEDVVQEAYLKALSYWSSFNPEEPLSKWFGGILNNCLKDKIKEEIERGAIEREDLPSDVQARAIHQLMLSDVNKVVEQEPKNIAYILKLFFFEQYKSREIADIVPESHTRVRQIVHNFRKTLRKQFNTRIFE